MAIDRMMMLGFACAIMLLGSIAAASGGGAPQQLAAEEMRTAIGGQASCDGHCDTCVAMQVGRGCGQSCSQDEGTFCWNDETERPEAGDVYLWTGYCNHAFPVGLPDCDDGPMESDSTSTYACTCQGGLCTEDWTQLIESTIWCYVPGCS